VGFSVETEFGRTVEELTVLELRELEVVLTE
jgi:hypothetical protein